MAQIRREEFLKIRKAARLVTEDVIKPSADQADREARAHTEGIERLAELGLLGLYVPPTMGGHPADARSFAAVVEEVSRACPSTALLIATHVASTGTLARFATEKQQHKWFSHFAEGKWLVGFAGSEDDMLLPINDPANLTVTKKGGKYVLNGVRNFVSGAHFFDSFLVLGRLDKSSNDGDTVFFIRPADTKGIERGERDDRLGLRAMASGTLTFKDAVVSEESLIGQSGLGVRIAREFKSFALLGAAAAALGISLEMVHIASDFVRDMLNRRGPQFGRQRASRYLADMAVSIQAMRLMVEDAAFRLDTEGWGNGNIPLHSYITKAFNAETALRVGDQAIKLIGGPGYSRQYTLERLFRDARGIALQYVGTDALYEAVGSTELEVPFISKHE